ncbi:MAG: META domain-containing protein [Pyrinomonadaceae bacterium]|nr:META domain-containing protein [Pyrinomonadaceae bacterium]
MKFNQINKIFYLFAIISIFGLNVFAQNLTSGYISQRWIPTAIKGKQIKDTKAFIEFSEGGNRLTGNAGCNRLFGTFEIEGKKLNFSDIGTTKMFCSGKNEMHIETQFLNVLDKTTSFRKNGDVLKLYEGKRQIAKLRLVKPVKNAGADNDSIKLEDKKWILEAVNNKSVTKVEADAFIVFNKAKQSAGGNTSCNVFGADYEADGQDLKITQAISTFRACIEDERMDIERSFLNGVQNVNRYEIKGEKLYLYQDKSLLLTFRGENK